MLKKSKFFKYHLLITLVMIFCTNFINAVTPTPKAATLENAKRAATILSTEGKVIIDKMAKQLDIAIDAINKLEQNSNPSEEQLIQTTEIANNVFTAQIIGFIKGYAELITAISRDGKWNEIKTLKNANEIYKKVTDCPIKFSLEKYK